MGNYSEYYPYAFGLVIAIPFLVLLRRFVNNFIILKNRELKLLSVKNNTENKLQAHERMTLFLERLKPANLVKKFDDGLQPVEFVYLVEKTINDEFDYNASQQVYIRQNTWNNILLAKNEILKNVKISFENLSEHATLQDLKTVFLMNYVSGEDYISETINDLRKDIFIIN